ncbi:MAG: prepilin-type N-terminal cleavage/methylation domain-containing protein [Deltaproteobacteria bacterium]|nr:prepilin-type N-terminal cleavage/methylation domain-containing protein [Deltaproteobacteria bacterium]
MRRADPADSRLRTLDSRLSTLDSSAQGFTLLEVMVALAILALGIVTVLELFAGSLRLGTKASRHTQAAIYAQNVMDRVFAQTTLKDGEDGGEFPGGYAWQARVQEIHPDENRSRLQPDRQSPTDFFHLKEIEIRVSWDEGTGQQALVLHSLRTLTEQPNQ